MGGKQHDKKDQLEQGKQGECGSGNCWLEDMISDTMISYWQNSTYPIGYTNYLRITADLSQEMVKWTPHLQKQTTFMRLTLEVGLKLAASPLPVFSARVFPFIFSWKACCLRLWVLLHCAILEMGTPTYALTLAMLSVSHCEVWVINAWTLREQFVPLREWFVTCVNNACHDHVNKCNTLLTARILCDKLKFVNVA